MTAHFYRTFLTLALGLAFVGVSFGDPIDIDAGPPDWEPKGGVGEVPFGVQMRANNRVWELPIQAIAGSDRRTFQWIYQDDVDGDGFRAIVSGVLDPDPSIAWGIAVTDFGAPTTFTFTFTTPIVPTGNPSVVAGSVSGGLTDATGNGVSITPDVALGDPDGDTVSELQVNEVGVGGPPVFTNMGVDVGGAVAFGPGVPGANYIYGPFTSGPIAGPPGVWTSLQSRVSFTLSGGGDIASLTGFASIVPEPGSMVIVAMGALALAGIARRRGKV